MMRLIFDIETDAIEATRVHCVVAKNVDTGAVLKFTPDDLPSARMVLGQASVLIGHNILGYDIPVLRRLQGFNPTAHLLDTMVLARLHLPDPVLKGRDFNHRAKHPEFPGELIGSQKLEAWGHRLGVHKDAKPQDFSVYTPETLEYCAQDVEVTFALFNFLRGKGLPLEAIKLEHEFAQVCEDIEDRGFYFDIKAAEALGATLVRRRTELVDQAKALWPGWEVPYLTKVKKLECTKFLEFNPTSRDHIARYLQEQHGWKPDAFTDGGKPQVDEKILAGLPWEEVKVFSELFMVQKRLGQLCEGQHSLLSHYNTTDSRIHGRIIHNGTVTSRCAHVSPNLAQVPRVGNPFGKEFRSLFRAAPGYKLVGVDAKGLELRCLAHYMAQWDHGAYAKALLEGDIHTENQKAAGLPTRDNAKTFIYAFLYGAGDAKLGTVVHGSAKDGRKLRQRFLKKLPALRKLQEWVQGEAKDKGWLPGLDGRKHYIRSAHAALNVLLQSAGAVAMKYAATVAPAPLVAHVHDEMQMEVEASADPEGVAKEAARSIAKAGEHFNFRCPLAGDSKVGDTWFDTH